MKKYLAYQKLYVLLFNYFLCIILFAFRSPGNSLLLRQEKRISICIQDLQKHGSLSFLSFLYVLLRRLLHEIYTHLSHQSQETARRFFGTGLSHTKHGNSTIWDLDYIFITFVVLEIDTSFELFKTL